MNLNKLDLKIKKLWYLGFTLLFILLLLPFVLPQIIVGFILPLTIVGVIVCGSLGVLLFWFPSLMYNRYTYSYDEKRIQINRGVIFKHEIVIPVCQIQDLHLNQGPLMQILHLQSIEISTAGSNYSINGIDNKKAKEFISELENYLNKRIEVLSNEEIL